MSKERTFITQEESRDVEGRDLRGGLTHRTTFDAYRKGDGAPARASRGEIDKELYGGGLLGESLAPKKSGELARRFMIPPFSVLSAREGWWQDRKRAWLSLGIKSELGRGGAEDLDRQQVPNAPVTADLPMAPRAEQAPRTPAPKPKARGPARSSAPAQPARKRFSAPVVMMDSDDESDDKPRPAQRPLAPTGIMVEAAKWGGDMPTYDWDTWDEQSGGAVGMDVESYPNFFCINFMRYLNGKPGKRISFEMSARSTLDKERLQHILRHECIVTFNGAAYDVPLVLMALRGDDPYSLKQSSDAIIMGGVKPWEVDKRFGITVPPTLNHIDLMEANPSVRTGLKVLGGRLHSRCVMDLPYDPNKRLTHEEMTVVSLYCMNDLDNLRDVFFAMKEPLLLRYALTKEYNIDMRSKSDAQIGEAIVRERIRQITGRRPKRGNDNPTVWFKYSIPDFIKFQSPQLNDVLDVLRRSEFSINGAGRIDAPKEFEGLQVRLGSITYSMGIGGIHSTEANRAVHSDEQHVLVDADVAGQYPAIILKLGMFPRNAGKAFQTVYRTLYEERTRAKRSAAEAYKAGDMERYAKDKTIADGGKIANNGVYGKLGSAYSFLYEPPLLVATTLTGQLSVLMLADKAEAAGIAVMSANTDGLLFKCPRGNMDKLAELIKEWESETGFEVETTRYRSVYSSSVNSYIAVKEDGKTKRKGPLGNPWGDGDLRGQMSKNPQMYVLSDALVAYINNGTPFEESIRACNDVRAFITTQRVTGGAEWRGTYLGSVVRYYWSTDSDAIRKASGKGKGHKVPKSDGARPLMELPNELPPDIDYAKYAAVCAELANEYAITAEDTLVTRSLANGS